MLQKILNGSLIPLSQIVKERQKVCENIHKQLSCRFRRWGLTVLAGAFWDKGGSALELGLDLYGIGLTGAAFGGAAAELDGCGRVGCSFALLVCGDFEAGEGL